MMYYAKIENNVVVQVIVADKSFVDNLKGEWIETSENSLTRKNYAGIGYLYNRELDMFITPKPYPSWHLDESKGLYKAPKDFPDDGESYEWDESKLDWVKMVL